MILVDTSVLMDYLRGRETPAVRRLDALGEEGATVGIPLPCVQEVLQGARTETEWRKLRTTFTTQELVWSADPQQVHLLAARIFFDCRRKGLTVRSSFDCLIAQIALERGDTLLHDDDDFEAIRKVRPLRTLRA